MPGTLPEPTAGWPPRKDLPPAASDANLESIEAIACRPDTPRGTRRAPSTPALPADLPTAGLAAAAAGGVLTWLGVPLAGASAAASGVAVASTGMVAAFVRGTGAAVVAAVTGSLAAWAVASPAAWPAAASAAAVALLWHRPDNRPAQ